MSLLTDLVRAIDTGTVEIVDLTAPLSSKTPILTLPERFGQTGMANVGPPIARRAEPGASRHGEAPAPTVHYEDMAFSQGRLTGTGTADPRLDLMIGSSSPTRKFFTPST